MDPKTVNLLDLADRNYDLARSLLSAPMNPPAHGWAAVIAFYAAVHYIGAYLWEKDSQFHPKNHKERSDKVHQLTALRPIRGQYSRLKNLGWAVRYEEQHTLSFAAAQSTLADLADIENHVRSLL